MTDDLKDQKTGEDSTDLMRDSFHFSHEAMATTFDINILCDDRRYASQASRAAFDEVDRLELEFSRFIENSDISRLNALQAGESLQLGIDTFKCLEHAQRLYSNTGGAFDITIGNLFRCWFDKDKNLLDPSPEQIERALELTGMDKLKLEPDWYIARVLVRSVSFDLGGIGKGYAADRMADILSEWSLSKCFVQAGASTVLAVECGENRKGWPVTLSNPLKPAEKIERLEITNRSVGGSGVVQGMHIIDPRPGKAVPVKARLASWSFAPTGVEADALSTAFMIMSVEQIEKYCRDHPEIAAITAERKAPESTELIIHRFGDIQ